MIKELKEVRKAIAGVLTKCDYSGCDAYAKHGYYTLETIDELCDEHKDDTLAFADKPSPVRGAEQAIEALSTLDTIIKRLESDHKALLKQAADALENTINLSYGLRAIGGWKHPQQGEMVYEAEQTLAAINKALEES